MSKTWKLVLGIIATVVVANVLLFILLETVFATAPISAGDAVYSSTDGSDREKECTIGYTSEKVALTAGHCVEAGQSVQNSKGEYVGKASRLPDRDIALINREPFKSGEVQSPSFGGAVVGDSVCMTSRILGARSCGEVTRIDSFRVEVTPALRGMAGDSGAGIIKNDEVVGIYTGNVKSETDDVLYSTFSLAP